MARKAVAVKGKASRRPGRQAKPGRGRRRRRGQGGKAARARPGRVDADRRHAPAGARAAVPGPRRRARRRSRARAAPPSRARAAPLPEADRPELLPRRARTEKGPKRRATAEQMATKQREISISEFFTKNRHLLGFDNPSKALLTTIKEAVDNSLDACEEAGILPEITIEVRDLGSSEAATGDLTKGEGRFVVVIEDNGPGIVKAQVPKIFGKLLYGSKFHRLKQSRGQQGIGISAAAMYGQLTTGQADPRHLADRQGQARPLLRDPDRHPEEQPGGHEGRGARRLAPGARHPGRARDRRELAGRGSGS